MKYTVVCPMHNEQANLYAWLYSVKLLDPDEVIVALDNCTDDTRRHLELHREIAEPGYSLKILEHGEEAGYRMRVAGLRRKMYQEAAHDIILNTSADLIHDPRIRNHLTKIGDKVKLVKFGYMDSPPNIQGYLRQLYSRFTPWKSMSGLMAFSREAWLKTEDLEEAKRLDSSEDTHLIQAIESRYRSRYVPTTTLHLRPTETRSRNYRRGWNYGKMVKVTPVRAFLTAAFMLRPMFFSGYIHQRRQRNE